MTIGNKIAFYRKKLNITQDALAQKLDVTNQAVSKWESDQCCPDILLLPKLADIFGVTIDELFDRAPQPRMEQQVVNGLPWRDDDTLRVVLYVGHRLISGGLATPGFQYSYDGPVQDLICAVSIQCGDVAGDVDAGGHVNCGDVGGNVDAGSVVNCKNVSGDVDAGSCVTCGDVYGSVDAGTDVTCTAVSGDVDAGRDVKCGDVGGDIDAGASIFCGAVGGDVDAGGHVECGDISGDVDAGSSVKCSQVGGDIDAGGPVTISK